MEVQKQRDMQKYGAVNPPIDIKSSSRTSLSSNFKHEGHNYGNKYSRLKVPNKYSN